MIYQDGPLYDFDDLQIVPAPLTPIRSRKEVHIFNEEGYLPLMTAPMDTVININNAEYFNNLNIVPVLPRTDNKVYSSVRTDMFQSYSLEDFENIFLSELYVRTVNGLPIKAVIDIANGHMEYVFRLADRAKKKYKGDMTLMVGNIANPVSLDYFGEIGVDYIRVGIGNGGGCLTTVQTGVGYPMASLIDKCYYIKKRSGYSTKIVADGGFKKYADVIKALGLGADYVMLGSIFNRALESAGETTREDGTVIDQYLEGPEFFDVDIPLYKTFRGMSTKEVQKLWGKNELKTSEGVVRRNPVEYTLAGWVDNFQSYLRSAMSYSGHKKLHQFIGGAHFNVITPFAFRRADK